MEDTEATDPPEYEQMPIRRRGEKVVIPWCLVGEDSPTAFEGIKLQTMLHPQTAQPMKLELKFSFPENSCATVEAAFERFDDAFAQNMREMQKPGILVPR